MDGGVFLKVLFIGNSHTYFNDMPYIFAYLCAARGVFVQPAMLTRGGECLENHARSEQVLFAIRYGEFDLCVLQEVESAFPGGEVYASSVAKLLSYTSAAHLPVGLYENFAPEGQAERQAYLSRTVEEVGEKLSLPVAKAGRAFALCSRLYPDIDLYFADRRHASAAGSYLVALCLIRFLLGLSVQGLPGRVEHWGNVIVDLSPQTARRLQQVAMEV